MAFLSYICTECGPTQDPCKHWWESENTKRLKWIEAALCEIIHILNRPQSATLTLKPNQPTILGVKMPATIVVGKTANSLFQEWTGPSGTGTVVPNAGAPAFTSSDTTVATVDPASGVATGVAPGTATITGTDPVNSLTASDVLTVTAAPPPPAVSATLTLTAV